MENNFITITKEIYATAYQQLSETYGTEPSNTFCDHYDNLPINHDFIFETYFLLDSVFHSYNATSFIRIIEEHMCLITRKMRFMPEEKGWFEYFTKYFELNYNFEWCHIERLEMDVNAVYHYIDLPIITYSPKKLPETLFEKSPEVPQVSLPETTEQVHTTKTHVETVKNGINNVFKNLIIKPVPNCPGYSYGLYGDFEIIFMDATGYINASKMCSKYGNSTRKRNFCYWNETKDNKITEAQLLINALKSKIVREFKQNTSGQEN